MGYGTPRLGLGRSAWVTRMRSFFGSHAANGTLLWQRTYGTVADELNSGAESGIDIAVAPDNSGVVVLGNYRDGNIFLAKFSPEGA